jgi:2-dehydropantoate 2-reductase
MYSPAAMRIGIVGAGGVGGVLAGLLARAGNDVALVTRGAARDAIRAEGLHIDSPLGVFRARVEAGSIGELGPVDALLLAVKTWQVPEVAPTLAPMLAPGAVVVPLQNGVDAADQCALALGPDRVFGGICHVLSWIEAPGAIRHTGGAPVVTLGAWRVPLTPRVEALRAALEGAGVGARIARDFRAALWSKFLFIASFGGVGAMARAPAAALREIPETRALLAGAFEEVRAVAAATGVTTRSDAVARALALVDAVPTDAIASLQRDLLAGRPSELESLSGAVARIGAQAGAQAPIHSAIYAALLPQERAARREAAPGARDL